MKAIKLTILFVSASIFVAYLVMLLSEVPSPTDSQRLVLFVPSLILAIISAAIFTNRYKYFSTGIKTFGRVDHWEILTGSKGGQWYYPVVAFTALDGKKYIAANCRSAKVPARKEDLSGYLVYYFADAPTKGLIYVDFYFWWPGIMFLLPALPLLYIACK
jgi:hypothetical protein